MENTPKDPKDRKPRTPAKKGGAQSASPASDPTHRRQAKAEPAPQVKTKSSGTAPSTDSEVHAEESDAPVNAPAESEKRTQAPSGEAPATPPGEKSDAERRTPAMEPQDSVPGAHRERRGGPTLAVALLALLVALGGTGFTLWQWQQEQAQQVKATSLVARLTTLEQSLDDQSRALSSRIAQGEQAQASELAALQAQQDQLQLNLEQERRRMQARKPHDWLLAEADYLVRMAGRKLWLEQDPATAQALLQDADQRLAQLDDPSIGPLRRALAADLATLAELPRVDRAALVAQMEALVRRMDQLPLNQVSLPDPVAETDPTALSETTSDWQRNLIRSWHALVDDFITVRRRDGAVQPLLAPEQDWYLREHIKGKLMQAQLALYHADQRSFVETLTTAEGWIRDYFDLDDGQVQRALIQLDQWRSTEIAAPQPIRFSVADPLSELVVERLGQDGGASR